MKKNVLAFFAVLLMSVVVGCSGETVAPEFLVDLNYKLDLGGMTFTFASGWDSEWYATEELPTAAVEKMMNRFNDAAAEYNFKFVMAKLPNASSLINVVAAQDPTPEMIDVTSSDAYNLYKAKILLPLNELPDVELTDTKWGPAKFILYGNYGGEQYGFFPWDWEIVPQVNGALIFNGELISSLGGTSPYEFQENGTWNWDTFAAELPRYSTVISDTQYTPIVCTHFDVFAKMVMHSNGAYAIEGDEASGYYSGYNSQEGFKALELANSLYTNNYIYEGDITAFTHDKTSVFFAGESYYGTVFNPNDTSQGKFCATNLNDYGFITFPTGPDGNENDVGSFTYTQRRLNYVTSHSHLDNADISTIINYMFEPLDDSEKEGWKAFSKRLLFLSDESYENFVTIVEQTAYDYSNQLSSADEIINSVTSAVIKGEKTPATAFSSISERLQSAINEIFGK